MLRRHFVFKIIPCLNPDGVAQGHFRQDAFGINLNRAYIDPRPDTAPSIYALKSYIEYLHFKEQALGILIDLHAQASRRGAFVFGNSLDLERQILNETFAKLISLNSAYFDYSDCDFSEKGMSAKDPKDLIGKEGTSRVAIFANTGLVHCYTLEMFYQCLKPIHPLSCLVNTRTGRKA